MTARIRQKPLMPLSVIAFLIIIASVALTVLALESYNSFLLTLILYLEIILVLAALIYFATGRRTESDYGAKYSFNREGILVNKHLVFPWAEIKTIHFRKSTERFNLTHLSSGNNRASIRALGMVPSRNGKLEPVYRTYSYGNIEVFEDLGTRPSVTIKCQPSYFRARRIFRKMQRYSSSVNPGISFNIQSN